MMEIAPSQTYYRVADYALTLCKFIEDYENLKYPSELNPREAIKKLLADPDDDPIKFDVLLRDIEGGLVRTLYGMRGNPYHHLDYDATRYQEQLTKEALGAAIHKIWPDF